jgi:hypothetical protein
LLLESYTYTATLFHGVLDPNVARSDIPCLSPTFTLQSAKSTIAAIFTWYSFSVVKAEQTLRLLNTQ